VIFSVCREMKPLFEMIAFIVNICQTFVSENFFIGIILDYALL